MNMNNLNAGGKATEADLDARQAARWLMNEEVMLALQARNGERLIAEHQRLGPKHITHPANAVKRITPRREVAA